MIKSILILLFITVSAYSCAIYEKHIPMADVYVSIDSKKSKTSFNITWEFKEFFIQSLSKHDKNKNGKFDLDEQKEIKDEYISHLEKNNYITEIVYVQKGKRVRKSLINKIDLSDSKFIFSDDGIKYSYNFDTDFVLKENHRLFIRFLDHTEKMNVVIKDVDVNNFSGKKVIVPQDIRANIYFYDYVAKYRKLKKISLHNEAEHNHDDHHHEH